jgi:hypothetical protein
VKDHYSTVTSKLPRVSLKVLAVVVLSMLIGQLSGYDITAHYAKGALSSIQLWIYGLALLLMAVVLAAVLSKRRRSKLVIHSADYRAVENGGDVYDVGDFLRQLISGDCLLFDVETANFPKNLVPKDPLPFKDKRLRVKYSYGDEPTVTTERREHGRLLLPEDSKIKWLQSEADRLKAAQPKPVQYPIPEVRLKILSIVSELQGFIGEHGDEPRPSDIHKKPGESDQDFLARFRAVPTEPMMKWRAKFLGDYRQKLKDKVSNLRDEMRSRAHIDDSRLNTAIMGAENESDYGATAVKAVIERFWELALKVNV